MLTRNPRRRPEEPDRFQRRPPERKVSWDGGFSDPRPRPWSAIVLRPAEGQTSESSPASSPTGATWRGTPARQRPASAGTGGSPGWPCSPARPADPRQRVLDALRDDFEAEVLGEVDRGANDHCVSPSLDMPITKEMVDLHLVDREALQVRQRGVPGAEVDGQPDPDRAQPGQGPGRRLRSGSTMTLDW